MHTHATWRLSKIACHSSLSEEREATREQLRNGDAAGENEKGKAEAVGATADTGRAFRGGKSFFFLLQADSARRNLPSSLDENGFDPGSIRGPLNSTRRILLRYKDGKTLSVRKFVMRLRNVFVM